MDLAEKCHRATGNFPVEERYGLVSQMRRAAVSVAFNIAEGCGRDSDASFVQFPRVSQGSLKELETQIILSERIGVMNFQSAHPLLSSADEIGRMLRAQINSLSNRGA